MQVDGSGFYEGAQITGATSTTLALDGTAEFSGNVTAATAPTADAHLANKAYVDSLDSANSADIAANAAAIAAETAARTAADTLLTTNLAAEEAARIAADDTKLALAGGTMTGAIQLGATANNSVTFRYDGEVNGQNERNIHISFPNNGYNNVIQIHSSVGSEWGSGLDLGGIGTLWVDQLRKIMEIILGHLHLIQHQMMT